VWILLFTAATIAGWLLVSGALGLGAPRVAGQPLPIVVAAVAIVVGIGALVIGAVFLFRVLRGWRRLLVVPWLLAVLVGVYSLSIALAAAYPPHPSAGAPPVGAVEADMTAADGTPLSGWYLPSANGAAIVLRHGAGSTAADTAAHARVLHEAGYGVLATDARGHGGSGGQGMELGWYGDPDTRASVDLLARTPGVDPNRIAVVGLSMGGEEAIGAAAGDGRIRAVVAEGATGRTAADNAWFAEEYGFAGVAQGVLDSITYSLTDLITPADSPRSLAESVAASAPTELMLIAAAERPDEVHVAARLTAVAPDRVHVWVVPEAGHVQGLQTAPDQWSARVVGFLDAQLGPGH
jgi:uncharacterized protein